MAIVYDYHRPSQKKMKGEEILEELLSHDLNDEDFEIYIEPFFIGEKGFCNPDMIILSNNCATIIEIKDWKFNNKYKEKTNGKLRFFLENSNKQIESPVQQILKYRENLSRYAKVDKNKIKVLLYFYNEATESAQKFLENETFIFGKDKINYIADIIRSSNSINKIEEINEIKKLITPDIRQNKEFKELSLTKEQSDWSRHKTSNESKHRNWHRVYGVAGSGKTLVISKRATNIAAHNLRVLVICFNKTLKNYIASLIQKSSEKFDSRLIQITNFHRFLFDFIKSKNDFLSERQIYISGNSPEKRTKKAIEAALYFLKEQELMEDEKFDAILIDESQDFEKEWFYFLTNFLTENDEILLVADDKQNLYDRNLSWLNTTMAGFRGRWGKLTQNIRAYRAPDIILKAKIFSDIFIEPYLKNLPDTKSIDFEMFSEKTIKGAEKEKQKQQFDLIKTQPSNYWQDCMNFSEDNIFAAYDYLKSLNIKDNEIAILIPHDFNNIKNIISQSFRGKIYEVFTEDAKENLDFEKCGLIFCNIKSFKGLEARAVVYIIPPNINKEDIKEHMCTYVALTRAKEYCIVLNCSEIYKDFGKKWESLPEMLPF